MVTVNFTFNSEKYGQFSDALHLPDDHGLSDVEIEALKQQRFDSWLNFITTPPQDEEV